jgi:ion channel-forming bestrophin family protein
MRPRSELMFDADKEYFREHRRVTFDFDYWAHMRSVSRYTLNTHWTRYKTIGTFNLFPFGHILASVSPPTAVITAIAVACYIADTLHLGTAITTHFPLLALFPFKLNDSPIAISAPILPLLLVFRTNNSATRYDEARKLWELLLNRTRDLARDATAFFPKKDVNQKLTFARWLMVFSIALKCHLRPYESLKDEVEGLLTREELALLTSADHKVCLAQMLACMSARDVVQDAVGRWCDICPSTRVGRYGF